MFSYAHILCYENKGMGHTDWITVHTEFVFYLMCYIFWCYQASKHVFAVRYVGTMLTARCLGYGPPSVVSENYLYCVFGSLCVFYVNG